MRLPGSWRARSNPNSPTNTKPAIAVAASHATPKVPQKETSAEIVMTRAVRARDVATSADAGAEPQLADRQELLVLVGQM